MSADNIEQWGMPHCKVVFGTTNIITNALIKIGFKTNQVNIGSI